MATTHNSFVLCIDETSATESAFYQTLRLYHPGDHITLLHVLEPVLIQPVLAFPPVQVTSVIIPEPSNNLEVLKTKAARLHTRYSKLCTERNVSFHTPFLTKRSRQHLLQVAFTWVERIGTDVIDVIKEEIKTLKPTLLVLGTNNKNFLER